MLLVYLGAHQGFFNSLGVTWDAGHIDIDLNTFSVAGAGLIMATLTAIQHHSFAAATGAPQSGDMRVPPPFDIPGGDRKTDPPPTAVPNLKGPTK